MKYTLITTKGTIMQFFFEEVAITYLSLYGGVIVDSTILDVSVDGLKLSTYRTL